MGTGWGNIHPGLEINVPDVSGKWYITKLFKSETETHTIMLEQTHMNVTGKSSNGFIIEGIVTPHGEFSLNYFTSYNTTLLATKWKCRISPGKKILDGKWQTPTEDQSGTFGMHGYRKTILKLSSV